MRRVNDAKAGCYETWMTEDLLGDWIVIAFWGGR